MVLIVDMREFWIAERKYQKLRFLAIKSQVEYVTQAQNSSKSLQSISKAFWT